MPHRKGKYQEKGRGLPATQSQEMEADRLARSSNVTRESHFHTQCALRSEPQHKAAVKEREEINVKRKEII